jgi:predicted TIM-barrel fold metal-dependent hydrolase
MTDAPDYRLPTQATDCHSHVVGPPARWPTIPDARYAPEQGPIEDYVVVLERLGIARCVLVQPSIYGTDNRALLDALAKDPVRLRGVAVVPYDIHARELEKLHQAGVRGVRQNIVDLKEGKGRLPLDDLRRLAVKIKPFGWHVEFLMHVDEFPELDRQLADFPVDVVFGHLGYVPASKSPAEPGFQALLRLMRDGKAWVKLTAPYRLTTSAMPYPETDVFAQALVDAAPKRLVWGTDWPHVFIKTAMPEDRKLLALLDHWVPDAAMRQRILTEQPAELYRFTRP